MLRSCLDLYHPIVCGQIPEPELKWNRLLRVRLLQVRRGGA